MDSKNEMPEESPIPVDVKNLEPLRVEIEEPDEPEPVTAPDGTMSLPPTTTAQEDIVTAGQRRVSIMWESVQGIISVAITSAVVYCQIKGIQSETLNNAFFFVVATYLQRTNHVRIGGVGQKANEEVYRGR